MLVVFGIVGWYCVSRVWFGGGELLYGLPCPVFGAEVFDIFGRDTIHMIMRGCRSGSDRMPFTINRMVFSDRGPLGNVC